MTLVNRRAGQPSDDLASRDVAILAPSAQKPRFANDRKPRLRYEKLEGVRCEFAGLKPA